jgi:hypothetical protein
VEATYNFDTYCDGILDVDFNDIIRNPLGGCLMKSDAVATLWVAVQDYYQQA